MDILLIKQPDQLSFSGNPIPYVLALSPYTDTERDMDIYVMVSIYVEVLLGAGTYQRIKSQNFYPDNDGLIQVDIQSIVDPYLKYGNIKPKQNKIVQEDGQCLRYYISYQPSIVNTLGTMVTTDSLYAIKGTISQDHWPSSYRQMPDTGIIPLFTPEEKKVLTSDKNWLHWILPVIASCAVRYSATLEDGTIKTLTTGAIANTALPNVYSVPVGVIQMGLDVLAGTLDIVSYTVDIIAGNTVLGSKTYIVDNRHYYHYKQIIWRDSIGGLDSICLTADMEYSADYDRTTVKRMLPPAYYRDLVMLPQIVTARVEETMNKTGNTGWLTESEAMQLRALFTSTAIWELDPEKGNLLPITLTAKTAKFFTSNDDMIAMEIAYSHAFVQAGYTDSSYGPLPDSCPNVSSIEVIQIRAGIIQLLYSLPIPYDQIHVKITIDGTDYEYRFKGNYGREQLNITAVTADTTATVLANVVCDEWSDPESIGAITTKTIPILAKMPIIVNNDTWKTTMNVPLESTKSGGSGGFISVTYSGYNPIKNDYSPDGLRLKIVDQDGSTDKGGQILIQNTGLALFPSVYTKYTPPNNFVGIDSFNYQVQYMDGTGTATGTVFIEVGNIAGLRVYAKLISTVTGNSSSNFGVNNSTTFINAKVTVQFFSDQGGTKPLDVTGKSITLNVKKETGPAGQNPTSTETLTPTASGTETQVYSGPIATSTSVLVNGIYVTSTTTIKLTLMPGTGYLII